MISRFNLYSKYYDLLYNDKNYNKESDYVIHKLKEVDPTISKVLELGCGSGGHAKYLCAAGLNITGIDRSPEMIDEAEKKNISGFKSNCCDISSFNLGEKFDATVSLFHVISYLTTNEEVVDCFKLTNLHLKERGLFMFDCWFTPAVYSQKPGTRLKEWESDEVKVKRKATSLIDEKRNVVEVNYEIAVKDKITGTEEIIRETHNMRHFSIPEIELLAELTGFEILSAEEFLTGAVPGLNTWGVCFLLRKK